MDSTEIVLKQNWTTRVLGVGGKKKARPTVDSVAKQKAKFEAAHTAAQATMQRMTSTCAPHLVPKPPGLTPAVVKAIRTPHDDARARLKEARVVTIKFRDWDGGLTELKSLVKLAAAAEKAAGVAAAMLVNQATARPAYDFAVTELNRLLKTSPAEATQQRKGADELARLGASNAGTVSASGDFITGAADLDVVIRVYVRQIAALESAVEKRQSAALEDKAVKAAWNRGLAALANLAPLTPPADQAKYEAGFAAILHKTPEERAAHLVAFTKAIDSQARKLSARRDTLEAGIAALTQQLADAMLGVGYAPDLAALQRDVAHVDVLLGMCDYDAAEPALATATELAATATRAATAALAGWTTKIEAALAGWVAECKGLDQNQVTAKARRTFDGLLFDVTNLVANTPSLHGYAEATTALESFHRRYLVNKAEWLARNDPELAAGITDQQRAFEEAWAAAESELVTLDTAAPGASAEFRAPLDDCRVALNQAIAKVRALPDVVALADHVAAVGAVTRKSATLRGDGPALSDKKAKIAFDRACDATTVALVAAREAVKTLRANGNESTDQLSADLARLEKEHKAAVALPATLEVIGAAATAARDVVTQARVATESAVVRVEKNRADILKSIKAADAVLTNIATKADPVFAGLFADLKQQVLDVTALAASPRDDVLVEARRLVTELTKEITRVTAQVLAAREKGSVSPFKVVAAALAELAKSLTNADLVEFLPERQAVRVLAHTELLKSLEAKKPEDRAKPVQELQVLLNADILAAQGRKVKCKQVKLLAEDLVKAIAALPDALAYKKQATAQVATLKALADKAGGEDAALIRLIALEADVTKAATDPMALAAADGKAVVEENQRDAAEADFVARYALFEKKRHAIKAVVTKAGGDLKSMEPVKSMGKEAKKLADAYNFDAARVMLDSAMEVAENIRAAPLGQKKLARDQLKATQQRWKTAVTAFNAAIKAIVKDLTEKGTDDVANAAAVTAALAEIGALTTVFNPAAFDKAVPILANKDGDRRVRRAEREAALKTVRRYQKLLTKDPTLLAVRSTPFGKTPQSPLFAAVNDLDLNIKRSL